MSKGPVDHTKKMSRVVIGCHVGMPRSHWSAVSTLLFDNISQLLRDSFSVSQQPPICEFPSHSSLSAAARCVVQSHQKYNWNERSPAEINFLFKTALLRYRYHTREYKNSKSPENFLIQQEEWMQFGNHTILLYAGEKNGILRVTQRRAAIIPILNVTM